MKKSDYLLIFGVAIIFLVGVFIIYYYFTNQINECVSKPFVYGAKQIENQYNSHFFGSGYVPLDNGVIYTIGFNSTDWWWIKP